MAHKNTKSLNSISSRKKPGGKTKSLFATITAVPPLTKNLLTVKTTKSTSDNQLQKIISLSLTPTKFESFKNAINTIDQIKPNQNNSFIYSTLINRLFNLVLPTDKDLNYIFF